MEKLRAVAAWTKHPNTPATDQQLFVEHEVKLSDGTIRTVTAMDPPDALNKIYIALRGEELARKHEHIWKPGNIPANMINSRRRKSNG